MAAKVRLSDLSRIARAKLSPKQKERLSKEQKAALKTLREAQAAERRQSFYRVLDAAKLPLPSHEWPFHADRRWRFDYAWLADKVALEVEGGVWTNGRHTRGSGFLKDVEKYNAAATLGWRVLRVTPDKLTSAGTVETIRRALK